MISPSSSSRTSIAPSTSPASARRRGQRSPSPDYAGDDHEKPSKVTLSGLLNFIDGLWSASGSERIVVFTRRTLAKNYLGVDEHPLFAAVEELLGEVKFTPADVAECLTCTRVGRGVDSALAHLIEELKKAKSPEKDADGEADSEVTEAGAPAPAAAAESAGQEKKI
nr:unnamed protein product [Digitaria exilis]